MQRILKNCAKGYIDLQQKKLNCKLCPFTGEVTNGGGLVKSVRICNTGEDYPIRGRMQCDSSNILYILTCVRCKINFPDLAQYGGETGQTAVKRFTDHHGTVTQDCHQLTNAPVGLHFRQQGHSISDCVFIPVEKINSKNIFIRKARERRMISSLNLIDQGMNRKL